MQSTTYQSLSQYENGRLNQGRHYESTDRNEKAVRVAQELACAGAASFLVSPLVSIIDRAIVQEISGVGRLLHSMGGACKDMIRKPRNFFTGLSFRLTFTVYFGTYAVANLSEAVSDFTHEHDESTRKLTKVSSAAAANIVLLSWRDSIFARTFASNSKNLPSKTPKRTLGLFATRDFITMAATFYGAPEVAKVLVETYGWNKDRAETTSALGLPVLSQIATAPLHIHAIDYYNRPVATFTDRIKQVSNEMLKVSFARGLRILPAFGIGSYSNTKLRSFVLQRKYTNQSTCTLHLTGRLPQQVLKCSN